VFANFPGTFDSLRVAAYGHSFGGSTSAQVALLDSRIVGGVNIDGPIYGSVGDEGIKRKPFVLVTNGGTPVFDPEEYTEFYNKIKGPRMQLVVRDTEHYAFTDVPLLLTEYEIPPESNATAVQVFGTLPGRHMEAAVNQIVSGAVELIFNYDTKPLEELGTNPDIEVKQSNLRGCH
jgi:dienelactone hydrolase